MRELVVKTNVKWLMGAAMTVPWRGKTYVLFRGDHSFTIYAHEKVHADQINEWGVLSYWAKHLYWRLRTLSLYAKCSPVEKPGYLEQYRLTYPHLSDEEIEEWMGCC